METKIILIRHGESQGNAAGRILGHTDLDLSELGYRQAAATAEHLKDVHVDAIYSSDLLRARNTAEPHAQMRGMKVETSEQLREIFVGDWEGHSADFILGKYGEAEYKERWLGDFGHYVFPGGEGVWKGGERFYREVLRIAKKHRGQTVIIAAHAAVIRVFWAIISGFTPDNVVEKLAFPTNASYSIVKLEGEALLPVEFSVDAHLASVGITEYRG